jgi:hypothetical protein
MEEAEMLDFEVTGVIEDIPSQSHFKMDMLGSLSTMRQFFPNGQLPQTWIWNPCWTYVLLSEGTTQDDLEAIFPDFYLNHYPDLSEQDVTLYLQQNASQQQYSIHIYPLIHSSYNSDTGLYKFHEYGNRLLIGPGKRDRAKKSLW